MGKKDYLGMEERKSSAGSSFQARYGAGNGSKNNSISEETSTSPRQLSQEESDIDAVLTSKQSRKDLKKVACDAHCEELVAFVEAYLLLKVCNNCIFTNSEK